MTSTFRLFLAQRSPCVGDIVGNAAIAKDAWQTAKARKADLVVLPEMFLSGYQPQDLVMKRAFLDDCAAALGALAAQTGNGPPLLIGSPIRDAKNGAIYNAAALLENGVVRATIRKHELPNYAVFDEKRLFAAAALSGPVAVNGVRIGIAICEDAWFEDVCETLAESGAQILIVPNGSPYARGKHDVDRMQRMVARAVENGLPLAYVNLCGAQDDQVFDGGSFALHQNGALAAQSPWFQPADLMITFEANGDAWHIVDVAPARLSSPEEEEGQLYQAMVTALGDYFKKNGFKTALLGLSGGVDSALTAVVAADALGSENVRCVMLPSKFTRDESLQDAAALADAIGAPIETVPIEGPVAASEEALRPFFEGYPRDLTEENLQARIRGLLLMALSNKTGALLLSTGNKSEVAVGYATLYGDMCGAYNPLKDLYKMQVFAVCRWRNRNHRDWMRAPGGDVIPQRIITKPPTAELREDQKDSDSLPPYAVLDPILHGLIEQDLSVRDLVEKGFTEETVRRVEQLIYRAEYKRFQSAPGPRLSDKAFWLDRRYPITNRWRST
jgi:NAD+ synthase